ncbi:MAG TPA: putative Ig domain-containing protein [Candidatus Acidoferrales bacterium]|nr:putative Ig domain-containing protein [Candidatus Acidoferrales bacterium]
MKKFLALRKKGSADGRVRCSGLASLACALVAFLCVTMISGCGGGNGSITLAITPKTASMDQGQSLLFVATLGNDTRNLGVTWQPLTGSGCAGTSCGTLTNITATGVTYTAPAGLTTGITVTLEAIAKANSGVTATSTITIVLPVTYTTTSLPNGSNGVAYSQTIVTTGGVAPITYTVGTGSLPAGLKLNSTGTVIGTPSSSGTSTFTINATDFGTPPLTVASPIFTITINPPPPLSITSTSMSNGITGTAYSSAIASSGGVPPLTWSVPPGTLPPGLELNTSSGLISGTPTTAGVFKFFPTVTDSAIPAQKFTSTTGVTISVITVAPLQSVTPPLPPGDVAVGYTASLVASGGVAPYTWSITSGQLPSGLKLNSANGTITGIPILSTTANFTVQVEDTNSTKSAPQTLSIVIAPGSAITNTLLSGAYSFLFHGFDSGGNVEIAGNVTSSGSGTVFGTLDSNRSGGTLGIFTGSTVTGTYSVGSDGRGTMQFITTNSKGAMSTTNYLLAEDSGGNFHMIENDTIGSPQTHGSGIMKPVVGGALGGSFFSGNYVLELDGQDNQGKTEVIMGVVHADGVSQVTPGMFDVNDGGTYSPAVPVTGSFSVGTNNDKGLLDLTYQIPNAAQVTAQYTFYFVSANDIFLMAVDPTDATHPRLGGELMLQQATAVFDATALNGVSVATASGLDGSNATVLAGLLTTNGTGAVSVSYDQNDGGTVSLGNTATGTYIADPSTNGRMAFTGLGPRFAAAYLTAPNQGILIGSDAAVSYGLLQAQTTPPFSNASILGGYTLSAEMTLDPAALNITGQLDSLTGTGSMTGILDEADNDGTPHTDQTVVIPNYVVAPTGRGTMQIGSTIGLPSGMVFYMVSPSSFSGISTDSNPGNAHPEVIYFNH